MKTLTLPGNLVLFVMVALSPAAAHATETGTTLTPHVQQHVVAVDTHRYDLHNESGVWRLTCRQDDTLIWEDADVLAGELTNLTLQAEGDRLIIAGIAGAEATLAGTPMEPGPFLAFFDREDGVMTAQATLRGPADELSVIVAGGMAACTLVSQGQVVRHYIALDLLGSVEELPLEFVDFVVENGSSSSDPSGNGDTTGTGGTGSGTGGTGSGGGS